MNTATINGLLDGISVVEKDNIINISPHADMLFNDNEPIDLKGVYYDEGFTVSEYRVEDFGEGITLTSSVTDSIINNTNQVDEYGFKLNY